MINGSYPVVTKTLPRSCSLTSAEIPKSHGDTVCSILRYVMEGFTKLIKYCELVCKKNQLKPVKNFIEYKLLCVEMETVNDTSFFDRYEFVSHRFIEKLEIQTR